MVFMPNSSLQAAAASSAALFLCWGMVSMRLKCYSWISTNLEVFFWAWLTPWQDEYVDLRVLHLCCH